MKCLMFASLAAGGLALLMAGQPATAANVFICDNPASAGGCVTGSGSTDPTMTFSLNDFNDGFSINGSPAQSGYSNPSTVTINEGSLSGGIIAAETSFAGDWSSLSTVTPESATIFFPEAGGGISDVLHYAYTLSSTNPGDGHLAGWVLSSDLGTPFTVAALSSVGITPTAYASETSGPFRFNNSYITAAFQPGPTPLPASWTMMLGGLAFVGFFAVRRTKNNSSGLAAA